MAGDAPGAIAYSLVAGAGSPVLLLHGLGGDHTVWSEVMGPLSGRHEVHALDLRGHGRSPTPDGSTFSSDELESDLDQYAARLRGQRFHLVGLSAGGFLALRYALERPGRLRSLSLLGGAAHTDAHTRAVLDTWAEVFRSGEYEEYVARLVKDLYAADWLEAHLDVYDRLLETLRHRDLRATVQWGNNLRTFDVRGRLGRVKVPTLVVHGMDDRVVDPSHARLLRQAIPGAEMRLLPYAGHMTPVEKPAEVSTSLLTAFQRGDAAPGRAP